MTLIESIKKSLMAIFYVIIEIEKKILKFICNFKEPPKDKTLMGERNKARYLTLPSFQTKLQ